MQGAAQLSERLDAAVFVFVVPPSMEVLEERLRSRGTESEATLVKRLASARDELRVALGEGGQASIYDYVITNDEVETAVRDLLHVIGASRVQHGRVLEACRRTLGIE